MTSSHGPCSNQTREVCSCSVRLRPGNMIQEISDGSTKLVLCRFASVKNDIVWFNDTQVGQLACRTTEVSEKHQAQARVTPFFRVWRTSARRDEKTIRTRHLDLVVVALTEWYNVPISMGCDGNSEDGGLCAPAPSCVKRGEVTRFYSQKLSKITRENEVERVRKRKRWGSWPAEVRDFWREQFSTAQCSFIFPRHHGFTSKCECNLFVF